MVVLPYDAVSDLIEALGIFIVMAGGTFFAILCFYTLRASWRLSKKPRREISYRSGIVFDHRTRTYTEVRELTDDAIRGVLS